MRTSAAPRTTRLVLAATLLALASAAPATGAPPQAAASEAPAAGRTPPAELFEVERVVDGDTLHVRRNGELQKLRLLSVDTEEKAATQTGDPTKPSTVFGEECAQWAAQFFRELAPPGEPTRVGLSFPFGREERDAYGRLLCHVILPDGTNYNLLLVELGKSPYFNKYGNDPLFHERFVAAQRSARTARRGIWDPGTNAAATPGAPSARRPYERLLPWWDARAAAVDGYRARVASDPEHVASAELPAELARALETSKKGEEVDVFGLVDRLFDEDDGSLTVLLRTGAKDAALRIKVPAEAREKFAPLELARRNEDFRQNYLWVRGRVERGPRGFDLRCADPAAIRTAEPELAAPAAPASK
jgi:micrococcal nuclease